MAILATRVSSSHFYITGEHDQEYEVGRRIELNQGNSGVFYVSVVSASYDAATNRTHVYVRPYSVQATLVSVGRGSCSANSVGAHYHTGHDDGGPMAASSINVTEVTRLKEFADLTGTMGQVLQTDDNNNLTLLSPRIVYPLIAGEDLVQYQLVFQDSTDSGKCKLAQQDATQAEAEVVGLVLDASIDTDTSGNVLLDGIVTDATWTWSAGAVLYLSETPGEMTETIPSTGFAVRCAKVLTATTIRFHNPYFDTLAATE